MLKNWRSAVPWQEFRSRYLWTLDVNDVFSVNIFGLQKLYNRHQTIHKTWLEYGEAKDMFTLETCLIVDYNFKVCYGYSKMTCLDESNNYTQHMRMQFVEFLELIGRVAVCYWDVHREVLAEVPLAKKIEFVLDKILPLVKQRRNEVSFAVESDSVTDEDY